jgi:hypothetical protein
MPMWPLIASSMPNRSSRSSGHVDPTPGHIHGNRTSTRPA